MYAIYVQKHDPSNVGRIEVLAIDIVEKATAEHLVQSIASSFASHGQTSAGAAYWFENDGCKREIWCEPERRRNSERKLKAFRQRSHLTTAMQPARATRRAIVAGYPDPRAMA